ncbi:quinol monooxygenase YgiN [Alteromonadaceae bacterium 2753L.S.0a.02]|nr:quinol monooxygenase YgiN [Alteromonadaceae bacterium 2753L.S.0a.02]
MIVEYIRYKIDTPRQGEFLDAYTHAQQALNASPHCIRYELSHCHEEPELFVLRIEWESIDSHMQGFRNSSEFKSFISHVRPYIPDIQEMQHYQLTSVSSQ